MALEAVMVMQKLDESLEWRVLLNGSFALSGSVNHLGSTGNIISAYMSTVSNEFILIRLRTLFNNLHKSVWLHHPAYFLKPSSVDSEFLWVKKSTSKRELHCKMTHKLVEQYEGSE